MKPETAKYLWDALTAAERIEAFVDGRSFSDYLSDEMLKAAVERQFEIIGEALGRVRRLDRATAIQIPELDRVVAFRNILIHSYASVDDRLVWGVVDGKLGALIDILKDILRRAEA